MPSGAESAGWNAWVRPLALTKLPSISKMSATGMQYALHGPGLHIGQKVANRLQGRPARSLRRAGTVRVAVFAPQDVVAFPSAKCGEIQAIGAEDGRKFREREVVLGAALRAQHNGELRCLDGVQLLGGKIECFVFPNGGTLVAAPRRRHQKPVGIVAGVRHHAVVAHPELVDLGVVARAKPVDLAVARVVVDMGVAASRAAGADALPGLEEPDARLEAKVLTRQRADRADVLGHQRVLVVELAARGQNDFVLVATLAHVENVVFGNLVANSNAACAHDAALGVVDDRRAEANAFRLVDRLGELALRGTLMLVVVVLELALAGLIADRAIDRMIEEQELLHRRLGGLHLVVGGRNNHVLSGGELTCGLKLRLGRGNVLALGFVERELWHCHLAAALDVHEAHPAVCRDRQPGVPTVVRDLDALAPRGFHDRLASLERNLFPIQCEFSHLKRSHSQTDRICRRCRARPQRATEE